MMQCPYDKTHMVSQTKLAAHIVKCQKRFDTPYLMECPFNATHRVPKDQFDDHINECFATQPNITSSVHPPKEVFY